MIKDNRTVLSVLLTTLLVLCSCNANGASDKEDKGVKTEQISYTKDPYIIRKAESIEGVDDVRMVQSNDKLLVAVRVSDFDRIQLTEITNKVKKKLKRQHPDKNVIVTSDKKIYLEIGKIEQQIKQGTMSNKAIDKKVERLIKLSKEKG